MANTVRATSTLCQSGQHTWERQSYGEYKCAFCDCRYRSLSDVPPPLNLNAPELGHFTNKEMSAMMEKAAKAPGVDNIEIAIPPEVAQYSDDIRRFVDAMAPGVDNIEIAIPPEVAQYSDDIRRFVDAMVYKLQVHAKKGRWENMGLATAMGKLIEEEKELTEAINRGNLVEILLESADVANFALIIASIAIERGN